MKPNSKLGFKAYLILLTLVLMLGCKQTNQSTAANGDKSDPAFSYDQNRITEVTPWTSDKFQNKPKNFQFAIIGDRTGGPNAMGTFDLAMDQLNLILPEFVINVGDLIDGYTDDPDELAGQWEEVEEMIDKLQMPFFYTIGNHDVTTPKQKEVWLQRRGADYYYFIYKDVLFMVLNSEDGSRPEPPPEIKESMDLYKKLQIEDPEKAAEMLAAFMTSDAVVAGLGAPVEFPEEQTDWIKATLAGNQDVRWTFLFMHEPCWENPSESFEAIKGMLADREYSMFGGHLHYYDYDNIDGKEYITMGPSGASFHHDGPGNVDHIMWVTMTGDGPLMGNIALKGLFDRKGLDPELFGAYDRKAAY